MSTKKPMTPRECYKRIALFQKADYIPNFEGGIAPVTVAKWKREGLPEDVTDVRAFFGIDQLEIHRGISYNPLPGHPRHFTDLPQTEDWNQGIDTWGRHGRWHKKKDVEENWADAAFEVVQGALEDPADWEILKDMFKPDIEERYGDHRKKNPWPEFVKRTKDHEHVLVLEAPSMVGSIKEFLGFENYCLKLCTNPDMIEEIMEKRTVLAMEILDRALEEVDFDFMWFWEDIGYRNGPILSPEIFERLASPRYKRLADWYRSRGGEIVAVDSDGDVNKLIPGWIKGGINHIWPLEVFAGMDVVGLRKEYGQDFSMRGGFDKFVIQQGKDAIDRELDRIYPVVQDGGYIPGCDHQLPHAPFENYCYYQEQKHKMLGTRPTYNREEAPSPAWDPAMAAGR
ncbi:MAG: hypothetical protein ACOC54_00715 [Candidatus Sumerlaeota bacterium]